MQSIISPQITPETLNRSLQLRRMGEGSARSQALQLAALAVEIFKLDAEVDTTDGEGCGNAKGLEQ